MSILGHVVTSFIRRFFMENKVSITKNEIKIENRIKKIEK